MTTLLSSANLDSWGATRPLLSHMACGRARGRFGRRNGWGFAKRNAQLLGKDAPGRNLAMVVPTSKVSPQVNGACVYMCVYYSANREPQCVCMCVYCSANRTVPRCKYVPHLLCAQRARVCAACCECYAAPAVSFYSMSVLKNVCHHWSTFARYRWRAGIGGEPAHRPERSQSLQPGK